jgi:formate-nitrite transporter family protein
VEPCRIVDQDLREKTAIARSIRRAHRSPDPTCDLELFRACSLYHPVAAERLRQANFASNFDRPADRPAGSVAAMTRAEEFKLKKASHHSPPAKARGRSHGKPENRQISAKEADDVEEMSSARAPVIYEIVRRLGDEEMDRPVTSLWWSGVAAGLSISFSLLAQALLQSHLPEAPWAHLVSSLGYSVGFLMVVLSRQQLFTENTVTAVLPVMADPTLPNLLRLGRLWGVVLIANVAGTLVAALFCSFTPVLTPELKTAMLDIAGQITNHTWMEMMVRAIASGFLIATMVWLLPNAEAAQFHVIVVITYLIAAAGFMHIVAGSMEAFFLVLNGHLGVLPMVTGFFVPVLIGNIIGGTALFALIAYAQVMKEI